MSQQGVSRFGQDSPARVMTTTEYFIEASERLPGEPVYQPLVPFVPPSLTNGNGTNGNGTTDDGRRIWTQYPSACHLVFYQGDDVVIPLFFADPNGLNNDMSDDAGWNWIGQIRYARTYARPLIAEFSTVATYVLPDIVPDPDVPGYTQVELFLPRSENDTMGVYRWELYSISPADYARFPRPLDMPAEDWPPLDTLRTWLWGRAYILPRGSTTDFLPPEIVSGGQPALVSGGWFAGPNGRVP